MKFPALFARSRRSLPTFLWENGEIQLWRLSLAKPVSLRSNCVIHLPDSDSLTPSLHLMEKTDMTTYADEEFCEPNCQAWHTREFKDAFKNRNWRFDLISCQIRLWNDLFKMCLHASMQSIFRKIVETNQENYRPQFSVEEECNDEIATTTNKRVRVSNPPHFGRAFKEYNAWGGKEGERALPEERRQEKEREGGLAIAWQSPF